MKLRFKPQLKNEARQTISWQPHHMKALLAGKITEIKIERSDKVILITPDKFGSLKFEAKSTSYWVAHYGDCL